MGGNSKNLTVIFILSLVKLCPSHLTSPHHCQQKTAAPDVSLKRSILINAAITAAFSVPLESWMRNGPGCMAAWQWRTWAAEAAILHSASRAPSRGPRHWRRIRSVAATIDALLRAHWNKYAQRAHRLYRLSVSIYIDEKNHQDKISTKFLWTKSTRNENCWRELGSKDPFCGLTTGILSTPTVSTVTNSAHQS